MPPLTPAPIPSAPGNLGGGGPVEQPKRQTGFNPRGDIGAQLRNALTPQQSAFGTPTPTTAPMPTSGPGWQAGDTTTSAPGVGTWYSGLGQMQQPPPNQPNQAGGGNNMWSSLLNLGLLSNPQTAWLPLMGIDLFGGGGGSGNTSGGLLGGILDPFFGGSGTGGGLFGDLFGGLFGGTGGEQGGGLGGLLNLGLLSNPDTAWIPLLGGLGGTGSDGGIFGQLFGGLDNNSNLFGSLWNLGGLLG